MSRLSEISFEPLEPYDGKLSCTVLRGERGSNAPDLPDISTIYKVIPVIFTTFAKVNKRITAIEQFRLRFRLYI